MSYNLSMESEGKILSKLSENFRVQIRKQSLKNEIRKKRREFFRQHPASPRSESPRECTNRVCYRITAILDSLSLSIYDKAARVSEELDDLREMPDFDEEELARRLFKIIKNVIQCVYQSDSSILTGPETDLALRILDCALGLSAVTFRQKFMDKNLIRLLRFSEFVLTRVNSVFILEKAILITANLVGDVSSDPRLNETIQECCNLFIEKYAPTFFNFFMTDALLFMLERIFLFKVAVFRLIDASKVIKSLFENLDKISEENLETVTTTVKAFLRLHANNKTRLDLNSFLKRIVSLQLCKRPIQKSLIEIIYWALEKAPKIAEDFVYKNLGSLSAFVFDECHPEDIEKLKMLFRLYECLRERQLLAWEDISDAVLSLIRVFEQRISFDWQSSIKIMQFLNQQFDIDSDFALVCFVDGIDTMILETVLKHSYQICSKSKLTEEGKYLIESIFCFLNRVNNELNERQIQSRGILSRMKGIACDEKSVGETFAKFLHRKGLEIKQIQEQFGGELMDEELKGHSDLQFTELNRL